MMRQKIVYILQHNTRLRKSVQQLKRAGRFLGNLRKRSPALFLHSTATAIAAARQPFLASDKCNQKIQDIENNLVESITLYRDVISYPLKTGRTKEFCGGLVDNHLKTLITEAIHIGDKGQVTQELPFAADAAISLHDLPEISQPVLFGGIIFNHFGHFLLESIGRLWAYNYVKELNPYILFYSDSNVPGYLEKHHFIHQVLSGFGIPIKKIVFINYPVKLTQVIIPLQKYNYRLRNKPDKIFVNFVSQFRFPPKVPNEFKNARNIYVSRSRIKIGRVIGESHFEEYLRREGYAILHPESYTLYQQTAIYNCAAKIIFCDGAAIHACILLPALAADIAVVARRRDPRWPGRNILDQFVGYRKEVAWIDCIKDQYQFGLESWHALSVVDWHQVSIQLKHEGFVNNINQSFQEIDFSSIIRTELRWYIGNIIDSREYSDFMIRLKEPLPAT